MANIITAGNSTNGGTAISTDTSGTLNIVTGSGSGATAVTIDSSQNVTIAGTLTATSVFAQGQTWQSLAGSRALGTTYTNSTNRPIMVYIRCAISSTGNVAILTINGAVSIVGGNASANGYGSTVVGVVPPSQTYSVAAITGGGSISEWNELR
jgi:hypothetical protein